MHNIHNTLKVIQIINTVRILVSCPLYLKGQVSMMGSVLMPKNQEKTDKHQSNKNPIARKIMVGHQLSKYFFARLYHLEKNIAVIGLF